MPAFVLMKAFENAPAQYDGAMEFLTLGRIRTLKHEIAALVRGSGRRVLDLGCGAGSLAIMMAKQGAHVVGIDTSESMLQVAQQRLAAERLGDRVEVRRLSAMEIDAFAPESFDFVVSTLTLSEFSDAELEFVLAESQKLLSPGGQLLIGDETIATGRLRRWCFAAVRLPLQLITYLATQAQSLAAKRWAVRALYFAIELPLMLLVFFFVPPSSRPLRDIELRLRRAGFRLTRVSGYLGGTLKLVCAARG